MIEKISLRLFWIAMLLCGTVALIGIWFFDGSDPAFFKMMPTFFIVGFASFWIWVPHVVYRFLQK